MLPKSNVLSLSPEDRCHVNENTTVSSLYQCRLCRKTPHPTRITCSNCVNTGQFVSSKRHELLTSVLNTEQQQQQQHTASAPNELQYADRLLLLEKLNREKRLLQMKLERKFESVLVTHRMSEEIQQRQTCCQLIRPAITRFRQKLEQRQTLNTIIQQRLDEKRSHIETIKTESAQIRQAVSSANDALETTLASAIEQFTSLTLIRQQQLNILDQYIFPIERISTIEDELAWRIQCLASAQRDIDNDQLENDSVIIVEYDRYQIVLSCLPSHGDYEIDKLVSNASIDDNKTRDPESLESLLCHEFREVLSALSHACQLINIVAFILDIQLPFRLHYSYFSGFKTDQNSSDDLRANITKLNINIMSGCLSQGIHIDWANVTHTLENLCTLLKFQNYRSQPEPVEYPNDYIERVEKQVNAISHVYITDYVFENENRKDEIDLENLGEWDALLKDYDILDDFN